ncbi:unnamed protein product [Echinostoma caproni]|uniref:Uncharacterized protein n=1 Tax=Echinostoma caproni TaxID=27848 RepID=A0A183ABP2_9TREM|nr:unnamed protein product [Echinostoma caproni]
MRQCYLKGGEDQSQGWDSEVTPQADVGRHMSTGSTVTQNASLDDARGTVRLESNNYPTDTEHDHLLATVLARLVLDSHTELVSEALDLLFRHSGQNEAFLSATKQIQLLVSDCDVRAYARLETNLNELRQLIEQSELWVRRPNASEDETVSLPPFSPSIWVVVRNPIKSTILIPNAGFGNELQNIKRT